MCWRWDIADNDELRCVGGRSGARAAEADHYTVATVHVAERRIRMNWSSIDPKWVILFVSQVGVGMALVMATEYQTTGIAILASALGQAVSGGLTTFKGDK